MTSCCFVIGIIVDWIVVIADWCFDWYTFVYYLRTGHFLWSSAAFILIFLPGITVFVAQFLDRDRSEKKSKSWWTRIIFTLPCFPLMVFYLGACSLWRGDDRSGRGGRKRMIHMKTYEGLLESSFMFILQLVVFLSRPPIGHYKIPHLPEVSIPDGQFWLIMFGLITSLIDYLWNVTEYHVLLSGQILRRKAQFKLAPHYLIHFLFRSLVLTLACVYWKYWIFICLPFGFLVNWHLTYLTHKRDRDHDIQESHLKFCYIVGGVSGILSPCLAVFYEKCTSEENLNFFYKWNILSANTFKFLIFLVLCLQLNFAHQGITSIEGEGNLWKRNILFTCHENSTLDRYPKEISLPAGADIKKLMDGIHSRRFLFWNVDVRNATKGESNYPEEFFMVPDECEEGQYPSSWFNRVLLPLTVTLGIVSTLLPFVKPLKLVI